MRKISAAILINLVTLMTVHAQMVRQVTSGVTAITFDHAALTAVGLAIPTIRPSDESTPEVSSFIARPKSTLHVALGANGAVSEIAGRLIHAGGFTVTAGSRVLRVRDFQIIQGSDATSLLLMAGNLPLFRIATTRLTYAADTEILALADQELRVTGESAAALGVSAGSDRVVGRIQFTVSTTASTPAAMASLPAGSILPAPPLIIPSDLTFCSLDSLSQFGRVGSVVGLAAATTSWNIGSQKLDWWAEQGEWQHPYIAQNMYRVKNDRFEQIGQSWVKHGYFALSDSQCDTQCSEITDGRALAPGCTDTYPAATNATQRRLGPRFEIDPWDGLWTNTGAHPPGHAHNAIDHRLQVDDADLDPAQNDNATYVIEGYYVHYQDTDVMNSAAWKPVTVTGAPGGIWRFGMGAAVRPNIGFAIDAWPAARKTVFAETLPPAEFVSQDGRSILAAKATPRAGGLWLYAYALLNVDMDRQIGSFEIPIPVGATVTAVEFHAPLHHGEAVNAPGGTPITNDPWTSAITAGSIAWATTKNPLRWGTVYSYSFIANRPPGSVTAIIKPFRGSGVATISGVTVGPQ